MSRSDRDRPHEPGKSEDASGLLASLNNQQLEMLRLMVLAPDQLLDALGPMMQQGRFYEAARYLEISAQQRLGAMLTGEELVDPDYPTFGEFHLNIRNLLWAGVLYAHNRHPRTGEATLKRAQLFVEEALRRIRNIQGRHNGQVTCVGLAFEMAGHCSAALSDPSGRDYYKAAVTYWDKSARLCPEELKVWYNHPVTETVISCLNPVVAVKEVDEAYYDVLFTADYRTRLDSARTLLLSA